MDTQVNDKRNQRGSTISNWAHARLIQMLACVQRHSTEPQAASWVAWEHSDPLQSQDLAIMIRVKACFGKQGMW